MDITKYQQQIGAVQATLNTIELKGADNMGKLIGCMQALQQIAEELEKEEN